MLASNVKLIEKNQNILFLFVSDKLGRQMIPFNNLLSGVEIWVI